MVTVYRVETRVGLRFGGFGGARMGRGAHMAKLWRFFVRYLQVMIYGFIQERGAQVLIWF